MGRIRSRQLESESIPERVLRQDAVQRRHIRRWAIGKDEVQPGAIREAHIGPHAVRQHHVDPALVPRETFSFEPDAVEVVACESADRQVHRGGQPLILTTLRTAPTGDLEITLYRNGAAFGTVTIPSGQTSAPATSFPVPFAPGDTARSEVTDPAADAEWLVITWVLR